MYYRIYSILISRLKYFTGGNNNAQTTVVFIWFTLLNCTIQFLFPSFAGA